MITCDVCPWVKDPYPDKVDSDGYHFNICGMSGNIVYTMPHKTKRIFGSGYIHFKVGTCGIFKDEEHVLSKMTEAERKQYYDRKRISMVGNENQ